MCLPVRYLLIVIACVVLSACQGEPDKAGVAPTESKSKTNVVQPAPDPVAPAGEKKEIAVAKDPGKLEEITKKAVPKVIPDADLKLTDEFLEKIDEKKEDYLAVPPQLGEKAAKSSRRIELSGKLILDDEEKNLSKKPDGGEVEISIPLN